MYAVIGRVKLKPGHEQESLAMIEERGVAMVRGFPGTRGGYWARTVDDGELVQRSFWLFDDEAGARAAETVYQTLREMPDAPATFIGVDVCEVVGQASRSGSRTSSSCSGAVPEHWHRAKVLAPE